MTYPYATDSLFASICQAYEPFQYLYTKSMFLLAALSSTPLL